MMEVTCRNHLGLVLCLLFALSQRASLTGGSDVFTVGTNITDGNTLLSANGSFTLGFFSPGLSTKRYLAIWFTVSSSAVCWVANRDRPLDDKAGVLVLTDTGSILLLDGSGQTIWTSNSTTSSANVAVAQLLESGNLVIHEGTANTIIWQSFDYLSDTLLPGMKMGRNLWKGTEWSLSSWRSADDPSPAYRLVTEVNGLPELFLWDGETRPVYRTGPWNGLHFSGTTEAATYSNIYKFHITVNSGEVTFGYTAIAGAPLSRIVVTSAGMLKRLVWVPSTQRWNAFYRGPRDVCDDYAMCGPFGICNANAASTSFCACPRGFTPASPSDWSLRENSGGCRRSVALNCVQGDASNTTTTDGFMVLQGVKLPDTFNATVDTSITLEECRAKCFANCSCVAYAPADISAGARAGCVIWTGNIIDLRYVDGGQDLYLRLPLSQLDEEQHQQFPVVLVIVGACIGLLVVVGTPAAWFLIKKRPHGPRLLSDNRVAGALSPTSAVWPIPELALSTIKVATRNFSDANIIGRGGYCNVFKADLPNGTEVAIKRLKQHRINDKIKEDFAREVEVMSRFEHVNLVKLLYRCQEEHEWILVYEFMENRSLDLHIFATATGPFASRRSTLNWAKRLEIIHGIAMGIKCLHDQEVIHRDLKPDNILLDETFHPKIADFATAKPLIDNPTTLTLVQTAGYVAPEYVGEGDLTYKCDVFSFGVILLEIVGGRRRREMPTTFLSDVWESWIESEIGRLLDPHVGTPDEDILPGLCRSVQIGLLCVQHAPEHRPAMSDVLAMLANTDSQLLVPGKPTPNSGAGPSALEVPDDVAPGHGRSQTF